MTWLFAGAMSVSALVYGATNVGSFDLGTLVAAYGAAAPFAILCWWQMNRANAKVDKLEIEVKTLQGAATEREKEFAQRLAPLLYESALLYRQGNEQLTKGLEQPSASELTGLVSKVNELVERLGDR